jgi:hypothetical protein
MFRSVRDQYSGAVKVSKAGENPGLRVLFIEKPGRKNNFPFLGAGYGSNIFHMESRQLMQGSFWSLFPFLIVFRWRC